jgi:uncharacterized protein (TIGR02391 family)
MPLYPPLTTLQRGLKVIVIDQSATLGQLEDMSGPEIGWFFLQAMIGDTQSEWSAPQLRAEIQAVVFDEEHKGQHRPVSGGVHPARLSQLVADALGWLISRGPVGPGSAQSGSGGEWRVTTAGYEAHKSGSALEIENRQRLHTDLHPSLEKSVRWIFERGDYATAVFAAMKAVEVSVRDGAGFTNAKHGDGVITEAFREGGPLAVSSDSKAEQDAFLKLFSGAYGAFRNAAAHRTVEYDSPTEAADIVHLADLLLRIVDRRAAPTA